MTFSFFYNLCFPMKIPISLQSFPKPAFENHVADITTRSIFWYPSLREASRNHHNNSARKCIKGKNVPHKVLAKGSSRRNAQSEPSRIIFHNKLRNNFLFGTTWILVPIALATDVLPFGAGFAGSPLGWD